jgi:hypothetical protein
MWVFRRQAREYGAIVKTSYEMRIGRILEMNQTHFMGSRNPDFI